MSAEQITIKTPEEIVVIRQGGKILAQILKELAAMVKPGVSTGELEAAAEKMILEAGGRPSFKGYVSKGENPFPTILCTSINDEIVHAPSLPSRVLKEGDIVGIDVGMEFPNSELRMTNDEFKDLKKGLYTDCAVTVPVGQVSKEARRLIGITKEALMVGIRSIKAGHSIADIGRAIERYAQRQGVGIVRDLAGHGLGYEVHEAPRIPNFFDHTLSNLEIKEGMVLALEPMFTLGDWRVATGPNGLTIKTADGSLAAHFEHTVVVTKNGCDIVTK